MTIYYFSHSQTQTGYGRAAREYIKALAARGHEVSDLPLASAGGDFGPGDGIVIHHGSPAQIEELVKRGAINGAAIHVAVTAWEVDFMPVEFGRALDRYDLVLVPSHFTKRAVVKSINLAWVEDGRPAPVRRPSAHVLPHCFDPGEWPFRPKEAPDDVFTFYLLEAYGERKNILGVLRAYLHAFDKSDKTRLVIISTEADFPVIRATIARSMLSENNLPGIIVPDRRLSDDEVRQVHHDGDCYVSATRGEGFGLGMFEAAITGRPVIAPKFGGHVDFLETLGGNQWTRVKHQMTPVFAGEGHIIETGGGVAQNVRLPRGANAKYLWAEPDLDQLARRMAQVREEYPKFPAQANREFLEDHYGIGPVGFQFEMLLNEAKEMKCV